MELKVDTYSRMTFKSITVSHKGEPTLMFDGGGYRTARMIQLAQDEIDDSLFKEVNEFVSKLGDDVQQSLYDCYARAETIYQSYDGTDLDAQSIANKNLASDLKSIIHEIYRLVKFDDLHSYVVSNRDLKIPPELSDSYTTDDKITPLYVARTYRLSEYIDLIAFCMGLRFIIPIWGPYLKIVAAAEGVRLKEYRAFELFRGSKLHASRAYERMDVYIRANTPEEDQTMATILHFLSSEEIPTYNIATTMVRKLSIAPLSCDTDRHHLMKILYSYATNRNKALALQLEPGLQDKTDRGVFEDDNSSVFCLFRMREPMSAGDLMVDSVYIENYVKAAKDIDESIPSDIVEQCVKKVLELSDAKWRAKDVQKSLTTLVMARVIAGTTIPLLDRKALMSAVGIAQAVLWHWGLHELAIILTARVKPRDESEFVTYTGRKGLSDETMEKLDALYPYKVGKDKRLLAGWSDNVGVRGIETIHKQLIADDWIPQCPKALIDQYPEAKYGVIEGSPELREHLASLLIRLDSIQR